MIFIFFLWVLLAGAVGVWGSKRGHSGIAAFFGAIIFTPILMFLLLLIWKGEGLQKCPQCAEDIKAEALKCKHCGHQIKAS